MAQTVLRRLKHAVNNPTGGEQAASSLAVKVKNHGSDGTKAKVTLDLGSGLSYKSASGISCNASGSTVNCSLDWIAGGTEKQFTITTDVDADTTGQVESSATVAIDQSGRSDSDTGNNTKSVTTDVVPSADLKVSVVAVDEGTDPPRESTSEWISFTTDGAPFNLSASQTDFTLVSGTAVSLTLTISTGQAYPEVAVGVTPVYTDDGSLWYVVPVTEVVVPTVNLSQGDNPDGVCLTLATDAVTPTLAGVEVGVVVSTTATMSGGDYTASIVGVSAGVSQTLDLNLTVEEPTFELRASTGGALVHAQALRQAQDRLSEVSATSEASVTLTEGGSASVTISADRFYGESDPISLGVLDAPAGLLYSLSPTTLNLGQTATLVVTDTALLANGTYTLTVIGFDGENTSGAWKVG